MALTREQMARRTFRELTRIIDSRPRFYGTVELQIQDGYLITLVERRSRKLERDNELEPSSEERLAEVLNGERG